MQNIFKLALLSAVLFVSLSVFAQIPNPGFENWSSVGFPSYQNPDDWGNLNSSTFLGGVGVLTCEKATGADAFSGNSAMKLTSKSVLGLGDAPGITVTGNINTQSQELSGGFPYTQRPTHLTGWYKYAPATGDNAEINVTLWKSSPQFEQIGEGIILPNTAVPNFTRFMVPITYTSVNAPDSARILLVSSNTNNIQLGSELIIDDLEFIDCNAFNVAVTTTDVTTNGGNDGSTLAVISGGASPYKFLWANGDTTNSLLNVSAGIYCVTVTDNAGCIVSPCGTVSEPGCSSLALSVDSTDVSTVGGSDGSATANSSGGQAPYSYVWGTGDTTQTTSSLNAGNYCVSVTDNNGCEIFGCVDVNEPDCSGLILSVSTTDVSTSGGNDGIATANPTGGQTPYAYSWNNGDTTQTITGLNAGNYCVSVTDDNGCMIFGCVDVNEPDCSGFEVSITITNESVAGANDGSAMGIASGGALPYNYLWNNGSTAQSIINLSPGQYCVTATDSVGCTTTACDTVLAGAVGISPVSTLLGISIYPNPVINQLVVELTNNEPTIFTIYDISGKVLSVQTINERKTTLPINLDAGNYIYSFRQQSSGDMSFGKFTVVE